MTNLLSFISGVGAALFGGKIYTMVKEKMENRALLTPPAATMGAEKRRRLRRAPYERKFTSDGESICVRLPRHAMPKSWGRPSTRMKG